MKRTIKRPEVRRLEIIKAAEALFEKKGYDRTPVEAIIKKAGIAKGTFYYYFKSKEEILKALVDYISVQIEEHFVSIVSKNSLSAIEKLRLMFRAPEKKAKTESVTMKLLHKPANRELQERLNIKTVKIFPPIIARVLEQGKQEGLFTHAPSVEKIQLLLAGSQFILDSGLFNLSSPERIQYLKALQEMLELMVGVKSGTLDFISKE